MLFVSCKMYPKKSAISAKYQPPYLFELRKKHLIVQLAEANNYHTEVIQSVFDRVKCIKGWSWAIIIYLISILILFIMKKYIYKRRYHTHFRVIWARKEKIKMFEKRAWATNGEIGPVADQIYEIWTCKIFVI